MALNTNAVKNFNHIEWVCIEADLMPETIAITLELSQRIANILLVEPQHLLADGFYIPLWMATAIDRHYWAKEVLTQQRVGNRRDAYIILEFSSLPPD